jgi:hypothetical protein
MSDLGIWAVISDIHGNSWALDAVFQDIERRGVTNIINIEQRVACLYKQNCKMIHVAS